MEKEQALSLKHKLPDFWLPSLTPTYTSSGPPQGLEDIKVQTTCRGGNPAHELSLKNLTPVVFSKLSSGPSRSTDSTPVEGAGKEEEEDKVCPSCKKKLSNNTLLFRAYLLTPSFPTSFSSSPPLPSLNKGKLTSREMRRSGETLRPRNVQDLHRHARAARQAVHRV